MSLMPVDTQPREPSYPMCLPDVEGLHAEEAHPAGPAQGDGIHWHGEHSLATMAGRAHGWPGSSFPVLLPLPLPPPPNLFPPHTPAGGVGDPGGREQWEVGTPQTTLFHGDCSLFCRLGRGEGTEHPDPTFLSWLEGDAMGVGGVP